MTDNSLKDFQVRFVVYTGLLLLTILIDEFYLRDIIFNISNFYRAKADSASEIHLYTYFGITSHVLVFITVMFFVVQSLRYQRKIAKKLGKRFFQLKSKDLMPW